MTDLFFLDIPIRVGEALDDEAYIYQDDKAVVMELPTGERFKARQGDTRKIYGMVKKARQMGFSVVFEESFGCVSDKKTAASPGHLGRIFGEDKDHK